MPRRALRRLYICRVPNLGTKRYMWLTLLPIRITECYTRACDSHTHTLVSAQTQSRGRNCRHAVLQSATHVSTTFATVYYHILTRVIAVGRRSFGLKDGQR